MKKNKMLLEIFMTGLILVASFGIGRWCAKVSAVSEPVIAIDAGHGGIDGGKMGVHQELEKDINLKIAKKVEELLKEKQMQVVMTRTEDMGLYDEQEKHKKQQDMKRRCAKINEADPCLMVSIHQNSYTNPSVYGPQVFYYQNSMESERVAKLLQSSLNEQLQIERPRSEKANDMYYILRKTKSPAVIVECGFLSNPEEAALLSTDAYQTRVAQAVCDGILAWIETKDKQE